MMLAQPQKTTYYREYCSKHPQHYLEYVCDRSDCNQFLTFECSQCREQTASEHPHQCPHIKPFTEKLHKDCLDKLTAEIKGEMEDFFNKIKEELDVFNRQLSEWYSPLDPSTTEREFVHTVESPAKWVKIQETARLKNHLIVTKLSGIASQFKKALDANTKALQIQMKELKYRNIPEKWKFDPSCCHELLNVSGLGSRTIDKKAMKEKYCVGMLNQPMTPYKDQVSFLVNSQNLRDKLLVVGVCSKKIMQIFDYEINLKDGIYAIYQAAKNSSSNNAFSLHSTNVDFHYKEIVGWNFKSGDTITINAIFTTEDPSHILLVFRKNKMKDTYEMKIDKGEGFFYPFVAIYSSGDKVSIEQ